MFFYSPWLFLAQISGLLAVTYLSLTIFFTMRLACTRTLFGGLQKNYKIHRRLAKFSILFLSLHVAFLLIHSFLYSSLFAIYFLDFNNWSINFGRIGFITFLVLFIVTYVQPIPYHIWKRSHEFMGLAFVFVAFHVLTIHSDVSRNMLLKTWVIFVVMVGFCSYIYTRFLYRYLGSVSKYVVTDIDKLKGKCCIIHLKPVDKPIENLPAEFVFISFLSKSVGREMHPFTIISCCKEQEMRIAVKEVGDHTSKFRNLTIGTKARVWGPYGFFWKKFLEDEHDQVWIAGGIGITPFLGMISYQKGHPLQAKKWLFYCTNNPEEASFDEYLVAETENLNITLIQHFSDIQGFFSADILKSEVPDLNDKVFMICGSQQMQDSIFQVLHEQGVRNSNIVFEDFLLRETT